MILTTDRLLVRLATESEVDLFFELWTEPRVMVNVGFPQGIPITRQEIRERICNQPQSAFGTLLVVALKDSGQVIGECKMAWPDGNGISETDIKLLPAFWGHKYGVEVKRALVNHLFTNTPCDVVQATPNVNNVASIKMQEAVGAVRVAEDVYHFPEAMRDFTAPVHCYVYHVRRENWAKG